ncbi:MAG TPA: hypothetical protein VFV54_04955 [Thermoanaerobaculia bacterium]|nr:hypothetical protein [Thermoanaerobaculia bacterium]
MKRLLLILLTLAVVSCGGGEPAGDAATAEADADATQTSTSTAEGYVENVTRAQAKAREMSEEEGERVKEVDEAMKDQ